MCGIAGTVLSEPSRPVYKPMLSWLVFQREPRTARGAVATKGLCFEHGYDFYFENGTLQFNSRMDFPLTLWKPDGTSEKVDLSGYEDGYVAEPRHAVDVVDGKAPKNLLRAASSRNGLKLTLAEGKSAMTGKPVVV